MKVQELIISEEAHLENLKAVERIRNEAKKMKKEKTFPKNLRFTLCKVFLFLSIVSNWLTHKQGKHNQTKKYFKTIEGCLPMPMPVVLNSS